MVNYQNDGSNVTFTAIAGRTYRIDATGGGAGFGVVYSSETDSNLDVGVVNGLFTAPSSSFYSIALDGATVSSFNFDGVESIDAMINAAFVSAKTYIDSKDAGLKAYTDNALAQLMATTDLTTKLALLEQINAILDGDAATAGFQAWEHSLQRLNSLDAAITTAQSAVTIAFNNAMDAEVYARQSGDQVSYGRLLAIENQLSYSISPQIQAVTDYVAIEAIRVETASENAFKAMKTKAAILFAV